MSMNYEELRSLCLNCQKCKLAETRTNVVFGVGNPNADVMFIGEGPGENEDLQGEPFVGRGGQLLDKFLAAVDLDRKKNIYIGNMVKCRPPKNRDPEAGEVAECIGYLQKQIELIQPKIIVCLGRIASCYMINPTFKVTKEHGQWTQKNGIWMMGTFHPAAVLRNPNNKPLCFEDMLALRDKILEVCPETYAGIELLGLPQMPK